MLEEFPRLDFEARVMQVEQRGYPVGPWQAFSRGVEQGCVSSQDMDREHHGFFSIRSALQRGIEPLHKGEVGATAGTVQREIEARHAAQIEVRIVVTRCNHATDRE